MSAMRRTRRKPPLDVDALWAIKRIGIADALARRRDRVRAGHVVRHGQERGAHRAVAVSDRTRRGESRRARPRRAHRRRQGQRSAAGRPTAGTIAFTAKRKDDDEPQIYLIAPDGGEARTAHVARDRLRERSSGSPTASASRSCRGSGRDLATDAAAGEAPEGAQGRQGQGARHRARRISLLGPLADRRPRAARVRLRRRHRPLPRRCLRAPASRCRRGIRRPTTSTSRPMAARSRVDRRSRRRAAA